MCLLMFNRNVLTISHSDESRGGHAMCWRSSRFPCSGWLLGSTAVYTCLSTEAWYDFTGFPRESGLRILRYRIWIQLGDDFFHVPLAVTCSVSCHVKVDSGYRPVRVHTSVSLEVENSQDFSRGSGLRTVRSMVGVFASGVQEFGFYES